MPQHRIGKLDADQVRALARDVLNIEADAVAQLATRIGDEFVRAVELCLACRGRIVVIGMGKSGHVGSKLAATLASTGSPAFFVHPSEASHGDLGMITGDDLVLALSNSGETAELVTLLPLIKRLGVPLVALTGKDGSTLAKAATVHLEARVEKEACPLNLAPTASTTAALALGDALAVALLEARGFTKEDFARSHPGGSLGRRLLLTVADLMHSGDAIPRVAPDALLSAALLEMTHKRLGMTAICDAGGELLGVFTDGDLRRTLDKGVDVRSARIDAVMTRSPKVGRPEMLAGEALELMDSKRINGLLVVDADGRLVGALGMHDLLRAGIVEMDPALAARAARIRLAVFDVDGVFTDGRLLFGPQGEALKQFHVRDGHGIKRLRGAGIAVAVISGRSSPIVAARMAELGVDEVHQGHDDKLPVLQALLARRGIGADECCYCGDDEPDLAPLRAVGLACAPADAHPEVRAAASVVTRAAGGAGAVREVCDLLLAAREAKR